MSKDWTPKELYMADQYFRKQRGEGLREQKVFWIVDGKEIPMNSPLYDKILEKYPNFVFLFALSEKLYKEIKFPDNVFSNIEKYLNNIISENTTGNEYEEILKKWYEGKLASRFYYREENDELLYHYILEHIGEI